MAKRQQQAKSLRNAAIAVVAGGGLFLLLSFAEATTPGLDLGAPKLIMPLMVGLGIFTGLQGRAGNRRVPVANAARRAAALAFPAMPGHGWVAVIRDKRGVASAGLDVSVDGRVVAQLMAKRFVILPLPVGPHRLLADIAGAPGQSATEPVAVIVLEGAVTGFVIRTSMGLTRTSLRLEPAPDGPALRRTLAGLAMVEPDAFPQP
ncbi:hypothetical protein AB2M62_10920 [Sphingomonas sp. MMS12-HWE2-04]|uniref:hypothetical protein n=1 Tax=Sphingomonas sp. MMS12-HWE2-04 TaxID=3234199 RepID=UPI00384AD80C